jgi:hypothetical protein
MLGCPAGDPPLFPTRRSVANRLSAMASWVGRRSRRRTGPIVATTVLLVAVVLLAMSSPVRGATSPPPNDSRSAATNLGTLPATVTGTTTGATVESSEPGSDCGDAGPSVWYRFTTGATPPSRIAVEADANGDLDAVVDVFIRQRSQNEPVACQRTDAHGQAAFTFSPEKARTYLVRVAQLSDSVSGSFSLRVLALPPPARAPGTPLASGGASGTVQRLLNASAAYSTNLIAGRPYRVNLASQVDGCLHLGIYAPGARSFDDASPVGQLRCQGYRLFTPRQSGRYSLLVQASDSAAGPQRFHLQTAPATIAETTPGVVLNNNQSLRAVLRGNRIDVLRLYRFDVTDRSNLELDLRTGSGRPFDLRLLSSTGRLLRCACGSDGDQSIETVTRPGRYFAAVSARDFNSGAFTLSRRSRTITSTTLRIDHRRYVTASPGASVTVEVTVAPAVSGRVVIEIDRFDPLAGWQFYIERTVAASLGIATLSFTPPSAGQWLAHAAFLATRTASASSSRYARVLVAAPLTEARTFASTREGPSVSR